jgi:hypothetical protein
VNSPLVRFLLLGALLFFLLDRFGGGDRPDERRIVVTRGQVESLAEGFTSVWKRPPTGDELRGLVMEYVKEEVYFREARAMGLDRDDWFLRQHLRRKLEFLKDEVALEAEPTEDELEAHLAANRDEFERDGELPPLDEIRPAVAASWVAAKRRDGLDAYYQELLRQYVVRVEQ